ncbi:MAG: hypothetical protein KDA65_04945 [Planctomycetaceae bacterium]|nr:hypothetical protein [Planctomycetaceae bacterium]
MSRWFLDTRSSFAASVLFCAVLLYFVRLPLWHTDLWGHLSYGRLIWETGELPEREPFLLTPDDRSIVDTAWLSQLVFYAVESQYGVGGLQLIFAVTIALMSVMIFVTGYRLSNRVWIGLVGTVLFLWLEWAQFQIIRPQLAGSLLFVLLACRYQFPFRLPLLWWIPPLLLLTANLHGSFIMGVGLTGAWVLAQLIDSVRQNRRLMAWTQDRNILWSCMLLLVLIAVPLINPYGAQLYRTVLTFSSDPNLYDLVEWKPQTIKSHQGKVMLGVCLLLIVLWRRNQSAISTFNGILLLVLGVSTLLTGRMMVWWAPVAVLEVMRQLQGQIIESPELSVLPDDRHRDQTRWVYQGISLLGVIIGFAWAIHERNWERVTDTLERGQGSFALKQTLSERTPLELEQFLYQQIQTRSEPYRMIHPMEWGDFFIWTNHAEQPVFTYSHVHLISRQIWIDYRLTMQLHAGWLQQLDRYRIDLVVLSKSRNSLVVDRLRSSPDWSLIYEDHLGVIFERINSLSENGNN